MENPPGASLPALSQMQRKKDGAKRIELGREALIQHFYLSERCWRLWCHHPAERRVAGGIGRGEELLEGVLEGLCCSPLWWMEDYTGSCTARLDVLSIHGEIQKCGRNHPAKNRSEGCVSHNTNGHTRVYFQTATAPRIHMLHPTSTFKVSTYTTACREMHKYLHTSKCRHI